MVAAVGWVLVSERLDRIKAGMTPEPIDPDTFATFMSDVVVNEPTKADAKEAGLKLMAAVLADLGYAEGVLIYGQLNDWYLDE
jgi:hypothetical protein